MPSTRRWPPLRRCSQQVRAGATPVALVAQDRVLVRRVRALLERMQIDLIDETGWTLSTTRAAARQPHACARRARLRAPTTCSTG